MIKGKQFINGPLGKFGPDKVLLDEDLDLSSNLGFTGFKVAKILTRDQFLCLKRTINKFIRDSVISAIGISNFKKKKIMASFQLRNITNLSGMIKLI